MEKLFGLEHLIASEEKTKHDTRIRLRGNYEHLPEIIDTLFKMPYFIGSDENSEAERGLLQTFCHTHYIQAPYTFWTVYDLYEKGYYLEGVILFRHLLEAFVQMRYFDRYPEQLMNHICNKKRVSFRSMFDEYSTGFYSHYYGAQLSGAAHGMIFKSIYRFNRISPSDTRTVMGCEYNEDHATYLSNGIVPIIFGFLNLFEKFFPNNTLNDDQEALINYSKAKEWLKLYMDSHLKANPLSKQFYEHINEFIFY